MPNYMLKSHQCRSRPNSRKSIAYIDFSQVPDSIQDL